MTDKPKFPGALQQMIADGRLSAAARPLPPSVASARPASEAPTTPQDAAAAAGEPTAPRRRGRPPGSTKKQPQSSIFGPGWRVTETIVPQTEAEMQEVKSMSQRNLIFQRSATRGDTQWNTVSVYEDGIDVIKRTIVKDEQGESVGWAVHTKTEPTIWNRPVYPVAAVLIHMKNAPSHPETDPTSIRKIRWKGRDFNSADWSEIVVSTSFDVAEVKAQKADSWFPVREANWQSGLLPWFRVMILNDPTALFRNPNDPPETKTEDLPSLPVDHMFGVTGWCSADKYAIKNGQKAVDWQHVTPSSPIYSGSHKPFLEEAGDRDLYIETMRNLVKRRPLMGVWCGIAAGGYAHGLHDDDGREFRGDTSTLLNLYGEGGTAKSTTMQIVLSMIGAPRGPLFVSATSDAGLELTATSANHGFFVIDELQKHLAGKGKMAEGVHHFMGLLNGVGRTVSANAGTEIRDRRAFDNLVLGTANNKLEIVVGRNLAAGDSVFAEAMQQRIIELDARHWSPFPSYPSADPRHKQVFGEIKELMATLTATHGHLYDPLIRHYCDHRDALVGRLRELELAYPVHMNTKSIIRQAHFFAYSHVGIDAFCEVLSLEEDVREAIRAQWELMVASMSHNAEVREDVRQDDIIERIVAWAEAHSRNFGVRVSNAKKHKLAYAWPTGRTVATPDQQAEAAETRSQQAEIQGTYGYFVQDEPLAEEGAWTGELWITSAGRQAMEGDRLTSLPLLDLLQMAHDRGWVDATVDDKGNVLRMDKKLTSGGYAYRILVGKARRDVESGEVAPILAQIPTDTKFVGEVDAGEPREAKPAQPDDTLDLV